MGCKILAFVSVVVTFARRSARWRSISTVVIPAASIVFCLLARLVCFSVAGACTFIVAFKLCCVVVEEQFIVRPLCNGASQAWVGKGGVARKGVRRAAMLPKATRVQLQCAITNGRIDGACVHVVRACAFNGWRRGWRGRRWGGDGKGSELGVNYTCKC